MVILIVWHNADATTTDTPGIDFLLNRNHINVGLSRAQTLSIVVGDPRTALNSPNSVGEMACLNLLAKLST